MTGPHVGLGPARRPILVITGPAISETCLSHVNSIRARRAHSAPHEASRWTRTGGEMWSMLGMSSAASSAARVAPHASSGSRGGSISARQPARLVPIRDGATRRAPRGRVPAARPLVRVAASYERESPTDTRGRVGPPPAYPPAPLPGPPPPGGPPPPPRGARRGGSWLENLTTPAVIIAAALALSVTNPQYVDQGREYLLLNLYQKESKERMSGTDQYNQAVVRDQVLYKFNKVGLHHRHVEGRADGGQGRENLGGGSVQEQPGARQEGVLHRRQQRYPAAAEKRDGEAEGEVEGARRAEIRPEFKKLPDLKAIYDAPEPEVRKRETNLISEKLALRNNRLAPPVE